MWRHTVLKFKSLANKASNKFAGEPSLLQLVTIALNWDREPCENFPGNIAEFNQSSHVFSLDHPTKFFISPLENHQGTQPIQERPHVKDFRCVVEVNLNHGQGPW